MLEANLLFSASEFGQTKTRAESFTIKIATGDEICTVTNDNRSERYHRKLFYMLREILLKQGLWPYREEGAETNRGRKLRDVKRKT